MSFSFSSRCCAGLRPSGCRPKNLRYGIQYLLMKIRKSIEEDLETILAVQQQNSMAAQWKREDYARLLEDPGSMVLVGVLENEDQERRKDSLWQGVSQESMGRTAPRSNTPRVAGFAVFQQINHESELRNLAVAPQYQQLGVGKALMQEAHKRLVRAGVKMVYLEVRPSNSGALAFYSSLGYTLLAERPQYYQNPPENALILSRALGAG